jgi:hypothetical protein
MDMWKFENSLPSKGNRYFSSPNHSGQLCSLLFNGHWVSFPEVKQLGHYGDHSPQPSTEVKNKYRRAPIPTDSVSTVSVICGSAQPEKNRKIKEINGL